MKIARINSFHQFINFFSPVRQYSYKPISTEVFYFLIHLFNDNIFVAHLVGFLVYFIGVYYLFKIIFHLSDDKFLSYLATGFFAINFTHVFQLYYLGTMQEVFLFTFLSLTFFNFLKGKKLLSIIFFVLALLSKETAVLFVPFLIVFLLIRHSGEERSDDSRIVVRFWTRSLRSLARMTPYLILGLIFTLIYQYSLKYVTALDNYKISFNPRLAINNLIWYFLWSLGVPNFTSLYFTSIFKPPIAEFWKMFKNFPEIKIYYLLLISYYLLFIISISYYLLKNKKKLFELVNWYLLVGLVGFFIFLGPILFFEHRWMVRLTIPLIFVVLIQSFLILYLIKAGKIFRLFGFILISLYIVLQILGISIHESSSTFLLESRFTKNAKKYLETHKKEIAKYKYIYFIDKTKIVPIPWGGSEKLKVTLGDQNFIDFYFPGSSLKAIYGFEDKTIPKDAYIVNSFDILLPN